MGLIQGFNAFDIYHVYVYVEYYSDTSSKVIVSLIIDRLRSQNNRYVSQGWGVRKQVACCIIGNGTNEVTIRHNYLYYPRSSCLNCCHL